MTGVEPSSDHPARGARTPVVFAALLGLAGIVAAVAVRSTADIDATTDGASLSLATIEAIKRVALLGPYSQYGWHHPGPLLFYILAPLYKLSGYHEVSLRWTALLVNVAAIGSILMLLRRQASTRLSIVAALALCALILRAGGDFPFSVWNPLITVLPFGLLLVVNAAAMTGRAALLPWSALISSFLIQTDIAYTPVVIAIAAVCVAGVLFHAWKTGASVRPPVTRAINRSAWIVAAAWSLPLAEEVVHRPSGNVDLVLDYFHKPAEVHHTLAQALAFFGHNYIGVLSSSFTSAVGHGAPESFPGWELAVALGLFVGGFALMWSRRTSAIERALLALCFVAAVAAAWSASRIPTDFTDYQLFWMALAGLFTLVVLVNAALDRALADRPGTIRWLRWSAAALLLVTVGLTLARMAAWQKDAVQYRTLSELREDLRQYALAHDIFRPVLYHTQSTWGETAGIVLLFAKQGEPIAVTDALLDVAGPHYKAGPYDVHCIGVFDKDRDAEHIAKSHEFAQRDNFVLAAIDDPEVCPGRR